MQYSTSLALLFAFFGIAAAAPTLKKRQYSNITDATILNYALTLEHLEDKFYREGLANYTESDFINAGFPDPFYANLKEISSDEMTHVAFLTSALTAANYTPVAECTYNFPSTDPKSFVALSSVLEGVGVSAYLGAAADIMSKEYLTAAGSILTIEARHSSYIRAALKELPFPSPFDNPLDLDEVYTLAAPFIVSCPPGNPTLPVKAFPSLALATTGNITAGSNITLQTPGYMLKPSDGVSPIYAAFITVAGPVFVNATAVSNSAVDGGGFVDGGFTLQVPSGIAGQSYVVLTGCNSTVTDDTVAAGPAIVEVTPKPIMMR